MLLASPQMWCIYFSIIAFFKRHMEQTADADESLEGANSCESEL